MMRKTARILCEVCMSVQLVRFRFTGRLGSLLLTALLLVGSRASSQTQATASCQFITFNTRFFLRNGSDVVLFPLGVNDYGTVVGQADNNVSFAVQGFTRFSGGNISYYQHGSSDTTFTNRDNNSVNLGVYGPSTALASANGTPFKMQGSTVTPLTITVGGTTYSKFTVWEANSWGTMVGFFADSAGKVHAFKRFSNGRTVQLDYPGAAQTVANAINDGGTIVGFYSKTASPNLWRHGFIYNNGKWATLDYPNSSLQTTLNGISNANLITATTIQGSNALNSFIYVNGTFKKMVMPSSSNPTYAYGVSLNKGLITGFSGYKGYIATCK
jgi:probable HAF family extracellular repeat protein